MNESSRNRLVENWQRTVDDVAASAVKSGRSRDEVRIIGVSKYVDSETAAALRDAGCRDLGEARPQQLFEKASRIKRGSVTWHLIGHLQRNKAKRVVELADVIHSVDSLKLLRSIADYANQCGRAPALLIEVNISGEPDKHGFAPQELGDAWPDIAAVASVSVIGLMAMAGLQSHGGDAKRQFAAVRELRDSLRAQYGADLRELSMGMSGDFDQAISEGATMVRIGSRLFEGIDGAGKA